MAKKTSQKTSTLLWRQGRLCHPQPDLFLGWRPYSGSYPASGITGATGFSTAFTSECPSGGGGYSACSLASVLETQEDWLRRHPGSTPADWHAYLRKYFLSSKACAGILRRAGVRGVAMPPLLERALRRVAESGRDGSDEYVVPGEAVDEGRVSHSLRAAGCDASEDGSGRGTPLVPMIDVGRFAGTLTARPKESGSQGDGCGQSPPLVPMAYQCQGSNVGPMGTLRAGNGNTAGGVPFVAEMFQVGGAGPASLATSDDNGSNQVVVVRTGNTGSNGNEISAEGYTPALDGAQPPAVFCERSEGHATYQPTEVASPLRTSSGGGGVLANIAVQPIPIDMRQASRGATMTNNRPEGSSGGAPGTGIGAPGDPSPSLAQSHTPAVAFHLTQDPISGPAAPCLSNGNDHGAATAGVAYAVSENQRAETRLTDAVYSVTGGGGKPGQGYPAVLTCVLHGTPATNVASESEHAQALRARVPGTLENSSTDVVIQQDADLIVRRLTPVECLRLQSLPDDWLDDLGLSDSAEYHMIGNAGVANCLEWIGRRLATALSERSLKSKGETVQTNDDVRAAIGRAQALLEAAQQGALQALNRVREARLELAGLAEGEAPALQTIVSPPAVGPGSGDLYCDPPAPPAQAGDLFAAPQEGPYAPAPEKKGRGRKAVKG